MFATIKRLFEKTGNKKVVANAVVKGYITEEQYAVIVGEEYAAE